MKELEKINGDLKQMLAQVAVSAGKYPTAASILFAALCAVMTRCLVGYVFGMIESRYGISLPNHNYMSAGLFILIYGSTWELWWKFCPANHGQILISLIPNFTGAKKVTSEGQIVPPSKKQIAIFEGWTGTLPWMVKSGEPISLEKSIPIEINLDTPSSDDRSMIVRATAAMVAIKSSDLVNYYGFDVKAAETLFKSLISAEIEKITRSKEADVLRANPKKVYAEEGLNELLSGMLIDPIEASTGRTISNITVASVNTGATSEKIDEALTNADKVALVLGKIVPVCDNNHILQNAAFQVVMNSSGMQNPTNVVVSKGK